MLKITYADLLKLVLDTSLQKHSIVSGEREHPGVTSMTLFFAKEDSGVSPTLTSSLSYQPLPSEYIREAAHMGSAQWGLVYWGKLNEIVVTP